MRDLHTSFANTHIKFTPAAMIFHKESPMLLDLAVTISNDEDLRQFTALGITINVGEHGGKVVVTELGTNEVVYCRQYEPSVVSIDHDNYRFYLMNDLIIER